ncbi:ABC transporter permease [Paenibacillus sp. 598K]|uniref:carbohydrate ABC transporter permease n=1 Tax=Paenibacillus sp. 598K TaxID=1117987 RepID=UPI000FF97661|nr:carbohydrate ABC transporter permease [Paenibacillus sp. 598K]GBF72552.1 ABC transporter permease [Paenibacillus sp. 598K]
MIISRGEKLFQGVNYVFLTALSFLFVYPFWRIAALSFSEGYEASKGGIHFWPRAFTWDNYKAIFARSDILDAYAITIGRTLIGATLSILLVSLMAYGLSKNRLRGRQLINLMLIVTLFFNGGLIPTYLLFKSLGLLNSFWVYVVPSLYGASTVFIFRSFFRALPKELEESAHIDGANDLTVYLKIVVPLSLPIFATMGLFSAVGHWNDYMTATLYVTKQDLIPVQSLLMKILDLNRSGKPGSSFGMVDLVNGTKRTVTAQSIKMATLVVVVFPIMCVYPFLQKYFVKGVIIGSLKG